MNNLSQYKILIVEDEEAARTTVRSFFERRWGAKVWDSPDAEEALAIIRHEKPDVILLDVMIEGKLNGWQVAFEAHEIHPAARIILVTGQLQVEKPLAELKGKVAGFLQKPAPLSEIEAKVIEVLGGDPAAIRLALTSHPAVEKKGSYEARKLAHELANVHNSIRMKCERFVFDDEDGLHQQKAAQAVVAEALVILKSVIQTIDKAAASVDKIREL